MELSPAAKGIRELANRLASINEKDSSDLGEPEHSISSSELSRLKVALKPLVSTNLQSRFLQILNKIGSNAPVSTSEAKVLTTAFIAMADIIAGDNTLVQRMRRDMSEFNDQEDAKTASLPAPKPKADAAPMSANVELK
jgi:hypothetical protein